MLNFKMRDTAKRRSILRSAVSCFVAVCFSSVLSGCLPGFDTDDGVSSNSLSGSPEDNRTAVNRSVKTSFLSFQSGLGLGARPENEQGAAPSLLSASFASIFPRRGVESNPSVAGETLNVPEAPITPPVQSLNKFYAAVAAMASGKRSEPITILHLGDDQITEDHFSGELREHFQSRFGNAGHGLMTPGLFPAHGMKTDRGGQWAIANSAAGAPGPYGITGVRLSSGASDAWVRLTASQGAFDWLEVTFASGPAQGTAVVSVDGSVRLVPTATRAEDETSIRITGKAKEILIKPRGDGEIALLSIATGVNARGFRYVNLGLPGATAETPEKWNPAFVQRDLDKLKPDLIVFGYGTREGFKDNLDTVQYERHLQFLMAKFQQAAPQASFLIVGPPDAARLPSFAGAGGAQVCRALNAQETANYERMLGRDDEKLGRWHSPPRLDGVRSALRRVASASGAFFWDWARFMGGPCSIHAWSSGKPPLASQDHVTLTAAGTDKSARALFVELMGGYDAYQRSLIAQTQAKVIVTAAASTQPVKVVKAKSAQKVRHVQ